MMVMKKVILALFFSIFSLALFAQGSCSTSWPYLYPEFQEGVIVTTDGKISSEKINVHLLKFSPHYIDRNKIVREIPVSNLLKIEIGATQYVMTMNGLLKVVLAKEEGYIGLRSLADFSSANETGGAYGTSSTTQATTKVSGIATNAVNTSIMELTSHKSEGQTVPLKTEYYLVANAQMMKATKKDINDILPSDKQEAFKSFLKKNKVNWKDTADLETVLDFLISVL